jgi:Mrp family chromosome partitioning ATPase
MTRTYAAVSNKGGAGKTTLVTLLAGEYAQSGDRGQHQSGRREKTDLRACESTQGHVEQVTGEKPRLRSGALPLGLSARGA